MNAVYYLNTNEINENFINGIKSLYKDKNIEIIINETQDETEYLTKNPDNYERLINNIKDDNKVVFNSLHDLMNEIRI